MTGPKKNILYLIAAQGFIYLAPLIVLPYLTRTLGAEGFGRIAYIQYIVNYFILITDYGFSTTATRLISIDSHSKARVSSVFANTIAVKMMLACLTGVFSLVLIAAIPSIRQYSALMFACFLGVFGNALFPTWMFQGLERMRVLALITCASRVIPLPLFFLYVKNSDDLVAAAALQNIPGIIAAVFSFYYAIDKKLIERAEISITSIWDMMKEGWAIFLSNISTSFYTNINGILIGNFAGVEQASFFYATDKLRFAAQGFIQPIASALFPRITVLSQDLKDRQQAKRLIQHGSFMLIGIELLCGLVMFFGADFITVRYLGVGFMPAAIYLKSLAFLPLVIAVATIFSQWRFQALGMTVSLSRIYLIAGPLHALYATFLTYRYHGYGLISSLYMTEIGITMMMAFILKRKKIPLF